MRKVLFIMTLLMTMLSQGAWAQTTTYTSYTVTDGSVSYYPSSDHDKLLDNNTGTKWCTVFGDGSTATATCGEWVEFNTTHAIIPTGYILTTCEDTDYHYGRNPKNWTLKGKLNAGDAWTVLTDVTNASMPKTNHTDVNFDISNTDRAYKYFRFEVNAIDGSTYGQEAGPQAYKFQLSRLLLKGTDAMFDASFATGSGGTGWSISPTSATDGTTVTVSYTGQHRVKSVKVVKKVAAWDGTITAQLAAKLAYTGGEIADFTDATDDLTTMTWAVGEHIAILYEVSGTKKVADAEITAVDGTTGAATITFTVEAGTPDDTPCTLVYPYDAAKDDHTGVKDAATLLAAQNGTLNANLDVRVGAGTIQTTTPSLTVTTQPEAQFAIFKFTLQDLSDAAKSATEFKVSDNSGNVMTTVTPGSASGELYVALPVMAAGTYWFNATIDSKPYIAKATVGTATTAGNYYQSTVKMATIGDVILSDGKFAARTSTTGTNVAMIAYLGSSTGVASYTHGLALALTDEASTMAWQAAINACSAKNTSTPVTGATWLLASKEQWETMGAIHLSQTYTALRDGFSGISGASNLQSDAYWSSTESEADSYLARLYDFRNGRWGSTPKADTYPLVRACLAF